jgi:hypothetical protein
MKGEEAQVSHYLRLKCAAERRGEYYHSNAYSELNSPTAKTVRAGEFMLPGNISSTEQKVEYR